MVARVTEVNNDFPRVLLQLYNRHFFQTRTAVIVRPLRCYDILKCELGPYITQQTLLLAFRSWSDHVQIVNQ